MKTEILMLLGLLLVSSFPAFAESEYQSVLSPATGPKAESVKTPDSEKALLNPLRNGRKLGPSRSGDFDDEASPLSQSRP